MIVQLNPLKNNMLYYTCSILVQPLWSRSQSTIAQVVFAPLVLNKQTYQQNTPNQLLHYNRIFCIQRGRGVGTVADSERLQYKRKM